MNGDEQKLPIFEFFTEIGIINQLSTTAFNRLLPDGLHMSHFIVLNYLARMGDGATPLQISRAMQVTKATMTHTLGVLKKRGLISIKPNSKDARSKLVYLTSTGAKFRENAIQSLIPAFKFLRQEIDIEEIMSVAPILRKVRQVLDENRGI